MGIKLGLIGLGAFGKCFAPLFISHPLVSSVGLCDAEESKMKEILDLYDHTGKIDHNCIFTSFDDMCKSDCDALVVITQPWLHAPQCIQAMQCGKDVYSAVPVSCLPDWNRSLMMCSAVPDFMPAGKTVLPFIVNFLWKAAILFPVKKGKIIPGSGGKMHNILFCIGTSPIKILTTFIGVINGGGSSGPL